VRRSAVIQAKIDQYKQIVPGLDAMHPVYAHRPEECVIILAQQMDSMQFEAMFPVSGYTKWMLGLASHRRAMTWHRRVLQYLQVRLSPKSGAGCVLLYTT
jgi:hypothetical protein